MIEMTEDSPEREKPMYVSFNQWFERMDYLKHQITEMKKSQRADRKAMQESIDNLTEVVTRYLAGGPAPKSGAAKPDQTPKGRRLAAEIEYAPEMTFNEMYEARDARWLHGKMYKGAMELMRQLKGMKPDEALHAAKRELYWMNRNDIILWNDDLKKNYINPDCVDKVCD